MRLRVGCDSGREEVKQPRPFLTSPSLALRAGYGAAKFPRGVCTIMALDLIIAETRVGPGGGETTSGAEVGSTEAVCETSDRYPDCSQGRVL
jgi:hypothetical protein